MDDHRYAATGDPAPKDRHAGKRIAFRVLGVVFMATALTLIGIAIADFFSAFSSDDFGAEPTKFWMFFLALPFFLGGAVCLNFGFSGAVASYMADEYSPAMRTASRELGLGGSSASVQSSGGLYCRSCGKQNDADARFCDSCGTATGS